jgi:hypothetical protein
MRVADTDQPFSVSHLDAVFRLLGAYEAPAIELDHRPVVLMEVVSG